MEKSDDIKKEYFIRVIDGRELRCRQCIDLYDAKTGEIIYEEKEELKGDDVLYYYERFKA